MTALTVGTADRLRRALDLLSRASEDWRGNGTADVGSLHWPVAVNLARRELARALEEFEPQPGIPPTRDRRDRQAAPVSR